MITLLSAEKEQTHMCLAQSGIKLPNCLRKNPASQDSFSAAVLCSLFRIPGRCEVGTQGVDYDGQSKDDQQDCNDQLQSFYQEGSRACRIRFCQSDCALYQCGAGYAKHDYQRREQHLVAAASDLHEYAQGHQDQGR